MILLLTLTILILSIGVVSANSSLEDSSNLDLSTNDNFNLATSDNLDLSTNDNSDLLLVKDSNLLTSDSSTDNDLDIESIRIISPIDNDNNNPLKDDENSTDTNSTSENDTNTSTGVITPDLNDSINESENITPGVLSGKTYINITNNAFESGEIGELPTTYDLRDYGWVTPIRDQSSSGSCWAFASIAALESFLLKTEGVEYDFSENNMKNIMGSYSENGTDFGPNNGGNEVMIMAYLLRWDGVISEEDDPYNPSSIRSPYNLTRQKYVTDIVWIPRRQNSLDNDQVKWAVMNYGAVYTGIYWDTTYEKGETYYYTGTYPYGNHAIAIVGWDDSYSASNFRYKPAGDGAFIIKNSWGTIDSYGNEVGKDGYYYVSYYDSVFCGKGSNEYFSAMAFTNVVNTSYYKDNYYYDVYGNTFDAVGYKNNTAWFANDFNATSNNPLKSIGFYTYGSSDYEAYIYVNNTLKYSQLGQVKAAGYHTVDLNQAVNLYKGDKFRVAVKLTTPNCLYPIAIERAHSGFTSGATASPGQSFVSSNGIAWEDLTSVSSYKTSNVCLKAYTIYAADLNIETTANVSYYSEGEEVEFTINITNKGDLSSAEIYSDLDENVKIVSYETTKGNFDPNTKIWTIEDLEENSSNILKLVIQINTKLTNITNSFYVNTSIYNMNNNSTSLNLFRRVYAQLSSKDLTTQYKSGALYNVSIVNEYKEAIEEAEVRFDVYNADNELVGTFYNITDNNGLVYLATDFDATTYNVKVSLVNYYYEGQLNGTFTILKADTQLNALNSESILNKTTTITADIINNYDTVNEGLVKFYVDGIFIGSGNVIDGKASIDYKHNKVGEFEITAVYEENNNYLSSLDSSNLKVNKITAILMSDDISSTYKNFSNYEISVLDENNNGVKGINLLVNIYQNGQLLANNYIITNNEGLANLNIDLSAGNYTFEMNILDTNFQGTKNNTVFINKTIGKLTARQISTSYDDTILKISFKESVTNKVFANQKVLISFSNGKLYTVTTDENGEADLNLDIGAGNFNYQLNSANNNIIAKTAGLVIIDKKDIKISVESISTEIYGNGSLIVKLSDNNNNPINNTKISLTIDGVEYFINTDNKGIAKFDLAENNLNQKANTYNVLVKVENDNYNVDSTQTTINILKLKGNINVDSITKYYKNSTQLEAILTDGNNNPIVNKTISFNYNGNIYNRTTNEDGKAIMNINLKPNTYNFTISFEDDVYEVENQSATVEVLSIPSTITVKNTVKYYGNSTKLTITLVDKDKKVLAGKTITITINSKTYTRTTNSKGVVNFNIGLKAGTYSVQITFKETGYTTISKKVSAKVISPKITYTAKTIKKGKYFTVNFKDVNGKVIKNQKVVIKIGSKTYNLKTNTKGNVIVKITLKKGKYKVVSSFAKNSIYGTSSKAITLTVK